MACSANRERLFPPLVQSGVKNAILLDQSALSNFTRYVIKPFLSFGNKTVLAAAETRQFRIRQFLNAPIRNFSNTILPTSSYHIKETLLHKGRDQTKNRSNGI